MILISTVVPRCALSYMASSPGRRGREVSAADIRRRLTFMSRELFADDGLDALECALLVSPSFVNAHISQLTVLDASWYLPTVNRDAHAEFESRRLPGARFFDIDRIADTTTGLPHMLPTVEAFAAAMTALGVEQDAPIVVYDSAGIFSAPRVLWTLRVFGARRVAVMNGGLPRWEREGFAVTTTPSLPCALSSTGLLRGGGNSDSEDWSLNINAVRRLEDMLVNIALQTPDSGAVDRMLAGVRSGTRVSDFSDGTDLCVDARAAARFAGTAPEPRAGVRGGHAPGARNVPFSSVLREDGTFRERDELEAIFAAAGVDVHREGGITLSCGSGVTACVIFLALALCGRPVERTGVYDGSWSEYGACPTAPVVT